MAALRHGTALSLSLLAIPVSAATLLVGNKSDHTVDLIDLETGASKATLPTGKAPHEIAVSPGGREAIVTNYGPGGEPGSTLTRVSIVDGKILGTIDLAPHGRPHGVVYTARDRVVVTTEESRDRGRNPGDRESPEGRSRARRYGLLAPGPPLTRLSRRYS